MYIIGLVVSNAITVWITIRIYKKIELKKNFFRFNFTPHALYEDIIRNIHNNSHDKDGKFDQRKFEDTLSIMYPILEQIIGSEYGLTIHNIYQLRCAPLSINVKSSCLPLIKDQSMMGTEKSVEFIRYQQRDYDEFKSEIEQYGEIEILVRYKYNKRFYLETHYMQILNDYIEVVFDKKTQQ